VSFSAVLRPGACYALCPGRTSCSIPVLIAGIFLTLGLAMEIIQGQLSYRGFDYEDLLANFVGVVVASALSFWFLAGWCQRIEQWFIPVKEEQ
jgi:VanZ family protein